MSRALAFLLALFAFLALGHWLTVYSCNGDAYCIAITERP